MKKWSLFFATFIVTMLLISSKGRLNDAPISIEQFDNSKADSLAAQIELGKQLFYDPILSRDSSMSCAICHKQELAFTDGLPKSIGIRNQEGSRNSPTLTNVLNRPYLLLDGVNPSLEAQVLVPISEHKEFDFHILLAVDRLNKIPKYQELSQKGYGTEITAKVLTSSIAEFERTLISNQSAYDHYLNGDKSALTRSQLRGKKLFFDELYCAKCHNGPDFTNDALTNNGLYKNYLDTGRMRLTGKEVDRGIFKVPTLRNIELTAPYMHDGNFSSLQDVIQNYKNGGKGNKNQNYIIQPFELSKKQETDLINFLKSLTDYKFISNPDFNADTED
tara:strand:+ start:20 stop:1018 length:999 start_codon:yes stop_codon:yes gene_type:complete